MATREYFPRRFRPAISQRTRWVTGIALQSWERHGWNAPWPQLYWFWRDRKGLVGNLLSPVANLFFLYGTASYLASLGQPRPLAPRQPHPNLDFGHLPPHLRHRAAADRRARPLRSAHLRLALRRGRADTHVLGKPGKFCRHRHRAMGIFEGAHQRPRTGMAQDGPRLSRGAARAGYQRGWVSSAGGCFRKRRNSGILLMNRSSRLSLGGSGAAAHGVVTVSETGSTGARPRLSHHDLRRRMLEGRWTRLLHDGSRRPLAATAWGLAATRNPSNRCCSGRRDRLPGGS